jgi:hypothetical protein
MCNIYPITVSASGIYVLLSHRQGARHPPASAAVRLGARLMAAGIADRLSGGSAAGMLLTMPRLGECQGDGMALAKVFD